MFQLHGDNNDNVNNYKYADKQPTQQLYNDAIISPKNSNNKKYIPKLVICGTVYNVQQHLPAIQKSIMRLVANNTFDLVHLLFANHNSTDDSVRQLEQWSTQLSKNVTVFSLAPVIDNDDDDDEPFKERTVRLAQARNFLWQQVSLLSRGSAKVSSNNSSNNGKSSSTGSQIDYVLMMDMDDVNWHLSNVHECLNLPPDWTVCCCNSYKVYYDLWALRTLNGDDDLGISNNNLANKNWLAVTAGSKSSQGTAAAGGFGRYRHSKPFRHIPAGHEPIPVKSCFGGAALYKYTNQDLVMVANSNPYVGMTEDDDTRNNNSNNSNKSSIHKKGKKHPVCEHVSFHLQLYAWNQSLYIQPSFLNDGPSDERMLYFGAVKKRLEPEYKRSWEETPHYYQHFWD
ncbi:hypothetical protein MHU86_10583 [Fragilaria crotonensis]|nr:hypothetical protein MHU86_10583 [Fragilaria crotonensis]